MHNRLPSILYVTDLYYQAKDRAYFAEDLYLTEKLKDEFAISLCHPLHTAPFENNVDAIVIRNSGPTIQYKTHFDAFFERVNRKKLRTYNSLTGKADMCGKNYLVTLYKERFDVIPTIDNMEHFSSLPLSEYFMVKPKQGADSIGLKKVIVENLNKQQDQNVLIQPFIDFIYEVSFYFIDANFQYALYAPNKQERWKLERYTPSEEDLQFAQRFIDWNTVTHGIQRVDGCRTADGNLLLVELEDLNPFLSIHNLDDGTKETFIENFKRSLRQVIYLPDLS